MPVYPEELKEGAEVFSIDGHKLGDLRRAVVKRSDLSLTHIVVDIGFLRSGHHLWEGGLGLDYDRVVPVQEIATAREQRLVLNLTAAQFKELPEYTAEAYETPRDLTPGDFDIPDVVNEAQRWTSALGSMPNFWLAERLNKSLDEVDIREGTPVWRREPHQKLGDVQRLLFDPATGRLRALVLRRGFLFHNEVVLPMRYISELLDDLIHVEISEAELDQLQQYRDED